MTVKNKNGIRRRRGAFKTVSDEQLMGFLAQYRASKGYPPTIREIGEGVGLKSTSAVAFRLNSLRNAGLLRPWPKGQSRCYVPVQ